MKLLILLAFVTGGWQLNTSQNLETKTVDFSVSAPVLQPAPVGCVGAACVGRARAACVGRARVRARACFRGERVRFFRGRFRARLGGC